MNEPLNKRLFLYGKYKDYALAKNGRMFAGLEFSGVDPKSMSKDDFRSMTMIFRRILQSINAESALTQYYCHFDNERVAMRPRKLERPAMLSQRREKFLNDKQLSGSHIFWLLDTPQEQNLNQVLSVWFVSQLLQAAFDKRARHLVKQRLSAKNIKLVLHDDLIRQADQLDEELANLLPRLESFGFAKKMEVNGIWALMRSMVNLNFDYLRYPDESPAEFWDCLVSDGDIKPVNVNGMDCLKISGVKPVYARIASVSGYGEESTPPGAWGKGDGNGQSAVVMEKGNYIICNRFTPFSHFAKGSFIKAKEDELFRQTLSVKDLMQGKGDDSGFQQHIASSNNMQKMLKDLDDIKFSDDRYGLYHSHVLLFEEDPKKLKLACRDMNQALIQSGLSVIWESAGLKDTFIEMMPGYPKRSMRSIEMNTSQVAATSLLYRSHQGQERFKLGANTEESMYVFESDDGTAFHYSPYVGDKCLVIGVGPTRAGKSFFKNVVSGHFMKYGGLYSSIDVDPGTEPLAKFYGDDGGIFTLEDNAGFNPFAIANGENDQDFIAHMLRQIKQMLLCNDNEEMQKLDIHEQRQLDDALLAVLRLPKENQSLQSLAQHCERSVKDKLSRFLRGGVYGSVFDNDVDGVGVLDKLISVYNLGKVKEDPKLFPLVNAEIFFRVVRLFEDPKYRNVPKILDIDECHYLLSVPGSLDFVKKKAVTWNKHMGGMGLWTQRPNDYSNLGEPWDALRSSASTFIFMSDQQMDPESYKKTFDLSDGEIETIRNLKQQQQALIKQPEIGVSKVVNLFASPHEYAVATSRPHEAVMVQECMDKHNNILHAFDEAVERIQQAQEGK